MQKCPGVQSVDKAHNRKNCPDKMKIGCNFCFLGLQAFSTLCQSVDFVNILSASRLGGAAFFYSLSVSFNSS